MAWTSCLATLQFSIVFNRCTETRPTKVIAVGCLIFSITVTHRDVYGQDAVREEIAYIHSMSITRNNHYVPQWYQEGFFEAGSNELQYLNLSPDKIDLPGGGVKFHHPLKKQPTSRAFCQSDLYSTFFGTAVNDEIERKLFGAIDTSGSKAVRAFAGENVEEWMAYFEDFFLFLDAQKVRTPKGLDWLRTSYPNLSQNELMFEMQGIRSMHCTIWTQAVREIVSAEDAGVKFITTDHPVTIYNHALQPDHKLCAYPNDPAIALKASQTIFPLNRNFCLILTNLEYAQEPGCNPLEKRTFARNFQSSMVRTDKIIRTRKLNDAQVSEINFILKARAKLYIAAGREDWLYPENTVTGKWSDLRETLLPKDQLYEFGGEMYAGFDDGSVLYQDAFGRREKPAEYLFKTPAGDTLPPKQSCGCGSGRRFRDCCQSIPVALRPTWNEMSIRERNMTLYRMIAHTLDFQSKDWTQIRRDLTDEQIKTVYEFYQVLWPLETDLPKLLPKPDGRPRAVYTGFLHPQSIVEFAMASPLYFGELIVQSPFVHAGAVAKKFNPVENPKAFRSEFLRSVLFFMTTMPLVEIGLVNLIPDPCDFDYHLRRQMMQMAEARAPWIDAHMDKEFRIKEILDADHKRTMMTLPPDALRSMIERSSPEIDADRREQVLAYMLRTRENDPLAVIQDDSLFGGGDGGQFTLMKLAPNFELAMYLAQATGAFIVTDSPTRWAELRMAVQRAPSGPVVTLDALRKILEDGEMQFPGVVRDIMITEIEGMLPDFPPLMSDIAKYLRGISRRGIKPNVEASLSARFARANKSAEQLIKKGEFPFYRGKVSGLFSTHGIQHNHVNRLLLMSSSEHHTPNVPMAFFIERPASQLKADKSAILAVNH